MAIKELKVGVDLGNYDVKSQHTITPSSYEKTIEENLIAQESIFYNNAYYYPIDTRNNQEKDKTHDEYALIMTLIGMVKEIVAQVTLDTTNNHLSLQERINEVANVQLGVGLPIGYFSGLKVKTEDYYNNAFKNGVNIKYKGPSTKMQWISFNFDISKIRIFPQDLTAVIFNKHASIPKEFKNYYIFGMGGGTVDIIPIKNGQPQVQECISLTKGTTEMYKEISKFLQKNGVDEKDYQTIEAVLRHENHIVPQAEVNMITESVNDFATALIADFKHRNLKLKDYPSIFIGGGALLLRSQLEGSNAFGKIEIIDDVKENAIYYAICL